MQHESNEKQMHIKMNDHRIFGPENSSSIQLLTRNLLNLLQAKVGHRERIVVNPHNTPTIDFYWNVKSEITI